MFHFRIPSHPSTEFFAMFRLLLPATLLAMPLAFSLHAAEPAAFPLKDGDVWVMAGDSITAQHLHSNYFAAFCYARYPMLTFAFRNRGRGKRTGLDRKTRANRLQSSLP